MPAGSVRFWALTAFTTSSGVSPLATQLGRIDVDHDLAIFAARRRRQRDARDRRQLLADAVDAVIVELLLAQRVRAQADLQHGHAGGVELHHDRRLDAGRHQRADRVGGRDDLRDRKVEIDVGLEVDLLHRQAGHGLRFDVPDAVDVGGDRILAVGGDALLHLRRAQAGIAPDHGHHGNIDFRKDVGRHLEHGDAAQKQDQRRHHIERVRKSQGETDDTHDVLLARAAVSRPLRDGKPASEVARGSLRAASTSRVSRMIVVMRSRRMPQSTNLNH